MRHTITRRHSSGFRVVRGATHQSWIPHGVASASKLMTLLWAFATSVAPTSLRALLQVARTLISLEARTVVAEG